MRPHAANTLPLRIGFGIFLTMNIMVFSWAFYSCEWYSQGIGRHDPLAGLFAYLLLLLSTTLITTLGAPLAADALGQLFVPYSNISLSSEHKYKSVKRGSILLRWVVAAGRIRLDMNALICIGVGAAYLISVIHTLQGRGSLYYDTAAMILVLVTLGYYLESLAKRKAMGTTQSLNTPHTTQIRVRRDGIEMEIPPTQLVVGDHLYTRAGESFVADAVVVEGISHVNESKLTGESKPRLVEAGHDVMAGTINIDGPLWAQAKRIGDDRVISQTQRLLEHARLCQMPIQKLADRVASCFVPAVLVLAAGVGAWHTIYGQPTRGLFDALSILLISCPCALGLAAPLASWSALRRAAHSGIIIESAATIERLAAINQVFFDKTGTLTHSQLSLHRIVTADGVHQEDALRWAAALESTNVHPIAKSILMAAQASNLSVPDVLDAKTLPGLGVEAKVSDRVIKLGSARFVGDCGFNVERLNKTLPIQNAEYLDTREPSDNTSYPCITIYLFDDTRILARFELAERLRNDARESIAQLKAMGVGIKMLSGDQSTPAMNIAKKLNIPYEASLMPSHKLEQVTNASRSGERVAMVGDGINDGPVLAGAEVGFVMSSGSDLAKQAGHVWLLSDRLNRVPTSIEIARHCMNRIRLNLIWAFGYNLIGLTLAAIGLLTPIISAMAMTASSLMIVMTSRNAGCIKKVEEQPEASRSDSSHTHTIRPTELMHLSDSPPPIMEQGPVSHV